MRRVCTLRRAHVRWYRWQRVAARNGVTLATWTSRLVGRAPYVLPGLFHVIPTVVGVETMPSSSPMNGRKPLPLGTPDFDGSQLVFVTRCTVHVTSPFELPMYDTSKSVLPL